MTLTFTVPVVEEVEALAEAVTKPPIDRAADGFVTLASLAPQPSTVDWAAVLVVEEVEALAEAVTKPPIDRAADGFVTLASLAPQPSMHCVASLAPQPSPHCAAAREVS